jgi:hypothetical protein
MYAVRYILQFMPEDGSSHFNIYHILLCDIMILYAHVYVLYSHDASSFLKMYIVIKYVNESCGIRAVLLTYNNSWRL